MSDKVLEKLDTIIDLLRAIESWLDEIASK